MSSADEIKPKSAVFDVCHTMYFSNTTHDYIAFIFERRPTSLKKLFYLSLNHRLSPIRYFLVALGSISGWDAIKIMNVFLLKGTTRGELAISARRFTDEILENRKIEQIHALIEESRASGLSIVLCSSSIDPVVSAIAEKIGIDRFFSTTLKYEADAVTGQIAEDITGRKLDALSRRDPNTEIALAVSDNLSDLELLIKAERGIAIVHNERKREFWLKRRLEIIDVTYD